MKPFEIMGQRRNAEYRIDRRNPDQHPEYPVGYKKSWYIVQRLNQKHEPVIINPQKAGNAHNPEHQNIGACPIPVCLRNQTVIIDGQD